MEVASFQSPFNPHSIDSTMEMDIDIDLGPLPEVDAIDVEPDAPILNSTAGGAAIVPSEDTIQPGKIHVRGVDEMTTKDIRNFATEHFPDPAPSKIEWVDDSSANILYPSSEAALAALKSFVDPSVSGAEIPQLQPVSAKPSSSHPQASLQVRLAAQSDRKKPRAHEASRFYMMHPEHDPRERLRREFSQRRRNGRRGDNDEYNRRHYDDREHRRRKEKEDGSGFDASMYDDNANSKDTSRSPERRGTRRTRRGSGDLFSSTDDTDKARGRLRNRSASPARNRLGNEDVDFSENNRRRFRDRTPLSTHGSRNSGRGPRENQTKELFPTTPQPVLRSTTPNLPAPELFPEKVSPPRSKKELFPDRTPSSNHRRSNAFDAADETADLFSKHLSIPFVDGPADSRRKTPTSNGLNIRGTAPDQGLSIRGSGGITIKGSANVKELFPAKFGNTGKELFSEKLEGRGGRRKRAEDLFY